MLTSVGISCRHVSVCLSIRLSQVGVLLKQLNVGSCKQRYTIAQGLMQPKISAKLKRGQTQRMLNAGALAANWSFLTQSIVDLARLQVYHTEFITHYLFAAHLP